MNVMLDYAVGYAEKGWPVFPIHYPIYVNNTVSCSCSAGDRCKKIGKHPATKNSFRDATRDPDQLRRLWGDRPYNIGAPTGILFDVLDDDPAHGGDSSLQELANSGSTLPPTATSLTGGGGRHFFLKSVQGVKNNNTGKVGAGLDYKTRGGYVVAPPSLHRSGERYRWVDPSADILDAPQWLVDLLRREFSSDRRQRRTREEWAGFAIDTTEGERHNAIASVAGLLLDGRLETHLAMRLVHGYNQECCVPPKSRGEVNDIIRYVLGHAVRRS